MTVLCGGEVESHGYERESLQIARLRACEMACGDVEWEGEWGEECNGSNEATFVWVHGSQCF